MRVVTTLLITATASGLSSAATPFDGNLKASGLGGVAPALDGKSKYDAPSTLPKFPPTPGTLFSGVFSDHVVLQRAPSKSAVYGVVFGAEAGTTVTVQVSEVSGGDGPGTVYSVPASVDTTRLASDPLGYATWKAFLKPAEAGGNFTIAATCGECKFPNVTSALNDVTFGDVWFCSGQSNMWLPMNMDTSRNTTFDAVLSGKYNNIRMHSVPHNNQPDGGWNGTDLDIMPPPPPWNPWGGDSGGGWLLPTVGSYGNKTCRDGLGDPTGCRGDPNTCCTGYSLPNQGGCSTQGSATRRQGSSRSRAYRHHHARLLLHPYPCP